LLLIKHIVNSTGHGVIGFCIKNSFQIKYIIFYKKEQSTNLNNFNITYQQVTIEQKSAYYTKERKGIIINTVQIEKNNLGGK